MATDKDKDSKDTVSIKEYMDVRFNSLEKKVEEVSANQKEGINSMSKFKDEVTTAQITYLTKSEFQFAHKPLETTTAELNIRLTKIEDWRSSREQQANTTMTKAAIYATIVASVVAGAFELVLKLFFH